MKINISHTLLKAVFIISLSFLIILISCRHVAYIESKAVIINRSFDVELKDSAMIYGKVYYAADQKTPTQNADIWIEGADIRTASDSAGDFNLKMIPGTYTIKCLGQFADPEFTMVIKDLKLSSNEKVEVRFFHGEKAE